MEGGSKGTRGREGGREGERERGREGEKAEGREGEREGGSDDDRQGESVSGGREGREREGC